mgnify:CR=1 FL=1
MHALLEGVYWETGNNEYNIQVQCNTDKVTPVTKVFQGWINVAEGIDSEKDEKILIFKKKFSERGEFKRLVRDLKYNNIINLKEVT